MCVCMTCGIYIFLWICSNYPSLIQTYPLWTGGRKRPPFPCVSHHATKMVSRWQRVNSVGLHRPPGYLYRDSSPKCCHHSETSHSALIEPDNSCLSNSKEYDSIDNFRLIMHQAEFRLVSALIIE